MSAPVLSGLGAGLGSFLQSGDIGKGVQTGLTAVLGGKLLGGLGGALGGQQTATNALSTSSPMTAVLAAPAKESILQPVLGDTLTKTMAAPGMMESALIGSSVASALDYKAPEMKKKSDEEIPDPRPKIRVAKRKPDNFQGEFDYFDYYDPDDYVQYARGGGLMSMNMGGQLHPVFNQLGGGIANALNAQQNEKIRPFLEKVQSDAVAEFGSDAFSPQQMSLQPRVPDAFLMQGRPHLQAQLDQARLGGMGSLTGPMEHPDISSLNSYRRDVQPMNPQSGKGAGLSQVVRPQPMDLSRGIFRSALGYAEGGEVEEMNEKDVILESILAIKGMKSEAEAQMILGKFLSEYGEAALRDLVDSVQSGEYDETVARFAEGEKGMVRGPGDGSGEDDKVPATLDNQQDVLLTEGEFVIRKPTTDALTKEYGGGFLDKINEAEGDAPEVLRKMVG
jgi:hypothetical protein